ncbi:MAG: metal ABC transporter permease [Planctomycetes bacterium]|nr:metal ABC transporter permease [Planctomycetota bacterium]
MLEMPALWLGHFIEWICALPWPEDTLLTDDHAVRGLIATLLVCFICGTLGSLVVGNRMAFFSDALAHCAFAGVGFGLLLTLLAGTTDQAHIRQQITLIMVLFGVTIGLLIALVREKTGLASDTVIGVFYAGSIGFGAIVMGLAQRRDLFSIEDFIFGSPTTATNGQVVWLVVLAIGTAIFLSVMYNWLVLASANPSLALSRQVPVTLCRYLFVVLLALMVNLSQQITGTLLINGLLIVPAAAAANLARNLRQMFWYSIAFALGIGLLGNVLSWEISNFLLDRQGSNLMLRGAGIGISGTVIVLSVLVFVVSIVLGRWVRRAG